MSKNVFDVVIKSSGGYYKKYFSYVTGINSGHILEARVRQEQRNGNLFTPEDLKIYVEELKAATKNKSDELTGILSKLNNELEIKKCQKVTTGKGQKLINERRLISNKMGVISFLQTTEQELIRKVNNARTR